MALPADLRLVDKPSINMFCGSCNSNQTFWMPGDYSGPTSEQPHVRVFGQVVTATYYCAACRRSWMYFVLFFGGREDSFVMKVGQLPAWDISVDQNLAKMLGDHLALYKHGLICESQGYGIGAHAYYRRIVETVIDQLLAELEQLVGEDDKEKYKEALEQTKKTKVAQEKIALVKDLLPASLRPGGTNPLGVLHHELSLGIHDETDDECLETAETIRTSLIFLVKNVMQAQAEARQFTDSMKKLLDKKSQKKKREEE